MKHKDYNIGLKHDDEECQFVIDYNKLVEFFKKEQLESNIITYVTFTPYKFDPLENGWNLIERDSLEDLMSRSKDLAAEAIIECIHLIEAGDPPLLPNRAEDSTHFSMPTREDLKRLRSSGHRLI